MWPSALVNIIDDWAAPMVAPELAEKIKKPEDIQKLTLLHDDHMGFLTPQTNWRSFFQATGLHSTDDHGPRFSQSDHAVDAALAGGGVISMTDSHLADGRLVMPLNIAMPLLGSYRIVCPMGSETRTQVARFITWVEAETQALGAWAEGLDFLQHPDI